MEWLQAPYLLVAFGVRADVEQRAGGNPSTNVGVDYAKELAQSGQQADVEAIYAQSGLSLKDDLAALAKAPRIHEDHDARSYLEKNASFTGRLQRPVLTIHDVADGALPASQEQASAGERPRDRARRVPPAAVRQPSGPRHLHTGGDHRGLRCADGPVQTGHWPSTTPAVMNGRAKVLGPALNSGGGNPVPPAYVAHQPLTFPRPFISH